jgi:23S rRNA (pseudouridine1915-N3)-methyltransferase
LKLGLAAIGHKLPEWADLACTDYASRLSGDVTLSIKALKPEPRTTGLSTAQIKAREAQRLTQALPKAAYIVALDERGKTFTTQALATQLTHWRDQSLEPWFIIGGADGLDDTFKTRASMQLRLSDMTLPHAMARVMLIEQLYRAVSLIQGHPYHRE